MVVEKVVRADPNVTYPCCVGGKRACPPEDCGGVWGYEEFLAAISDAGHPEHESMLEWVGGSSTMKPSTSLASLMWPPHEGACAGWSGRPIPNGDGAVSRRRRVGKRGRHGNILLSPICTD